MTGENYDVRKLPYSEIEKMNLLKTIHYYKVHGKNFININLENKSRPIKKGICFRLTGWRKIISPGRPQKIFFAKHRRVQYVLIKQLRNIFFIFKHIFLSTFCCSFLQ